MRLFSDMAELAHAGLAFVIATVVETQGSTPQKPGAKMLVLEDGSIRGTIGGGAIELQIVEAAKALLLSPSHSQLLETHLTHDLGMCCGGKMKVFLEKNEAAPRLFLFGAGHVAKEVCELAHHVGFHVTVVDDRPDFATTERFPHAQEVRKKSPFEVAQEVEGGDHIYFCVVTHDHPLDQACVEALLRKPSAYLGVIGSRRKAERFKMRLLQKGFTEEEWSKVHSPMGLAIHALTPAEIAVSIVGEFIQKRRERLERR